LIIVLELPLTEIPYDHALSIYTCRQQVKITAQAKNHFLEEFERKYKDLFLLQMKEYNTINIWQKFKQLPENDQNNLELRTAMRHLDHTINITWVMQHLNAIKYIDHSGLGNGEATGGGSDWKNTCTQSIRSEYFSRSVVTGRNCKLGNRTK
jgi:tryptophan 2,3-dioxygenase